MKLSAVMVKNVCTVDPDDTVKKAVFIMNKHNIGSVIVVEGNKPIGIITERDILRKVVALDKRPGKMLCKNLMRKPVKTISANATVLKAIELMAKYHIKKLAVTRNGMLVGIITATDILKSPAKIEEAALKRVSRLFPVYKPKIRAA